MTPVAYLIYDTETTGLDDQSDEIIEICLIPTDRDFNEVAPPLHLYAYPTREVPPEVAAINGYNKALWDERNAVTQQVLATTIIKWAVQLKLNRVTHCGHNVSFDERFLGALCRRHGMARPYNKHFGYHRVDTVGLSIMVDQVLFANAPAAGRKLEVLAERYGIEMENAHTAITDARAVLSLIRIMRQALRPSPEASSIVAPSMIKIGSEGATFAYGKHAGKTIQTVASSQPGYVRWALDKCDDLPPSHRALLQRALDAKRPF